MLIVNDGICRWPLRRHNMMINHNHIHAQLSGALDLFVVRDPTINRNQKLGSSRSKLLNMTHFQPISLLIPVWNIILEIGKIYCTKKIMKYYRSTNPICIVITEDNNFFIGPYRMPNTRDRSLHIFE